MNTTRCVCVVTGGANGIGRCIAESFASNGAFVAVIDMDREAGELLTQRFDGLVFYFPGDVAEKATLDRFATEVLKRFGAVDVLVNNACLSRKGILSNCSYDDFLYVQQVGVAAPYYLTNLFRDHFTPGASVINIASTRAFMSQADTESYTAAKGGISALTHALSVSLAGHVRVNSISPGWIETAPYHEPSAGPVHSREDQLQHPVGRVGTPLDIASAVRFLCSEDASFITGQNLTIDGGMTTQMIYHGDCGWVYRPGGTR